jgi:hypothetical protein
MRKLLLPIGGIMLICGALLMPYPSEAAAPGLAPNLRGALSLAGPVEQARCWRRRVCAPRGCFWRTTCRRWW